MSENMENFTSELALQVAVRARQIQRRLSEDQPDMSSSQADKSAQNMFKSDMPNVPHTSDSAGLQNTKMVPAVPARAYERAPPEIPPKRFPLKNCVLPVGGAAAIATRNRQPPPLPKKSNSAHNSEQNSVQNSPLSVNKFREKPPIPVTRPDPSKQQRWTGVPPMPMGHNEFGLTPNEFTVSTTPSGDDEAAVKGDLTANHNVVLSNAKAKTLISPSEDFGSADALRGIEKGLRNMERAMQEQISLRSMEAAAAAAALAAQNQNFDGSSSRLFSRPGSFDYQSHDENRDVLLTRHAGAPGPSLEELQLRAMHLQKQQQQQQNLQQNSNASSTSVSSNASPTHSVEYPPPLPNIDHHMRSLDRNLPLEVQYSRHRQTQLTRIPKSTQQTQHLQAHRVPRPLGVVVPNSNQHSQAEMHMTTQGTGPMPLSADLREQIRQQLLGVAPPMSVVHNTGNTPGSAAAAALLQHQAQSRAVAAAQVVRNAMIANVNLTREELRMRRRSSHDESVTSGAESFANQPGRHFFIAFLFTLLLSLFPFII